MSEEKKSPEEKGKEAVDTFWAGAEYAVVDSLKSVGWLAKWGCIGYAIYFVLAAVAAFVLFAIVDLFSAIPPWLIVVGFVLAVVIYYATRKPEPPRRT